MASVASYFSQIKWLANNIGRNCTFIFTCLALLLKVSKLLPFRCQLRNCPPYSKNACVQTVGHNLRLLVNKVSQLCICGAQHITFNYVYI